MDDIVKSFYDRNKDIWGEPQEFKQTKFFPIALKDIETQNLFYSIFQIPKKCYDKKEEIAKSSYAKYLFKYVQLGFDPKGNQVIVLMTKFLSLVTKSENVKILIPNNIDNGIDPWFFVLSINNVRFDESEFDIIREIILLQNGLSTRYVEDYDESLEKQLEYSNQEFGNVTYEEEIITFASLLRKPVTEIKDLTLYQFKKQLDRLMLLSDYHIYFPLEVSGQIQSKDGSKIAKHYFSHIPEKSRYGSILISWDAFLDSHADPDMINENGEKVLKIEKDKK